VEWATGGRLASGAGGCVSLERFTPEPAALGLAFGAAGSVGLEASAPTTVQLFLRTDADPQLTASPINLAISPGLAYLNVNLAGATPYLVSTAPLLKVCGASR
jgi:hypothetical protein